MPVPFGVKWMLIVQVAPGASDGPQDPRPARAKSPLTVSRVKVNGVQECSARWTVRHARQLIPLPDNLKRIVEPECRAVTLRQRCDGPVLPDIRTRQLRRGVGATSTVDHLIGIIDGRE